MVIVLRCCFDKFEVAQLRCMSSLLKNTAAESYKAVQLLTQRETAILILMLLIQSCCKFANLLKERKDQASATADFVLQTATKLFSS